MCGPEPLAHFFAWYSRTFDLGPADRFTVLSGLAHDPLLRDVLLPMWCGASSYLPSQDLLLDARQLQAWVAAVAPTVVHLTPQMARLLTTGEQAPAIPSIRLVCVGGDVLTDADVAALRRLAHQDVSITEAGRTGPVHQDVGVTEGGGPGSAPRERVAREAGTDERPGRR